MAPDDVLVPTTTTTTLSVVVKQPAAAVKRSHGAPTVQASAPGRGPARPKTIYIDFTKTGIIQKPVAPFR